MTMRRAMSLTLPPLVPLVMLTIAIEALVRAELVRSYLVPAPSRVFSTMTHDADLWSATGETAIASIAGFAISGLLGLVIALLLSSARWVQRAFYPYAVFFQTVPLIAIAPLLVIWLGFGMETVIASAVIASIFPVIANALAGLLSIDPALRDLFALYGANPGATMVKLRLPGALPSIFTGLRIAGGLAVVGAIVGEFITTGNGLGGVILISRQLQRVDRVFAGVLLAALLGIALFTAINLASRLTLRHWHASERD